MKKLRLILSGEQDAGFNMAVDEALSYSVRKGWTGSTLRIYQWKQPAVSLGCHQTSKILERFSKNQLGKAVVVQRPTAGGAVLHGKDVSYALVLDQSTLKGRSSQSLYAKFHGALAKALPDSYDLSTRGGRSVPSSAVCFQAPVINDLMREDLKIAGAAQRRWRNCLLQQGTVQEPSLSRDRIALFIRSAWMRVLGCEFEVRNLTADEHVLADELWSKYRPWKHSSLPRVSQSAFSR